jgi:hypothetical protein
VTGRHVTVILHNAAVIAAALLLLPLASAQPYSIRWVTDEGKARVEVTGVRSTILAELRRAQWSAEKWQNLLSAYVDQGDVTAQIFLPAMLGSYAVDESTLRFAPQFPLQRGIRYRAVFRPQNLPGGAAEKPVVSTFALAVAPQAATTRVTQIFPSADVLPENLLKFYVHFSAPMSRGQIYDHIQLRAAGGRAVELPFLQIDEELWDANMTRLTLFIDPGRIKRGVLPLEEVGPALEAGKKYELVIDRAWHDAAGNPLKESFTKRFTVGPPKRAAIDPAEWKIAAPKAKSLDPVAVTFSGPMDHALALRLIQVVRESGKGVAGAKTLVDHEERWLFTPESPWEAGQYALAVPTHIEDLAGNNIGKPFEVDLFEGVQRRLTNTVVKLPFVVR